MIVLKPDMRLTPSPAEHASLHLEFVPVALQDRGVARSPRCPIQPLTVTVVKEQVAMDVATGLGELLVFQTLCLLGEVIPIFRADLIALGFGP
jgi:hypothetical protein